MKIQNKDITSNAEKMVLAFNDNSKYIPAKVNFIIQRNKKVLIDANDTILKVRRTIAEKYGTPDPEDSSIFLIPEQNRDTAQKEIDDLMNVVQELPIMPLPFGYIEKLEFTANQMDAIIFMLEDTDAIY